MSFMYASIFFSNHRNKQLIQYSLVGGVNTDQHKVHDGVVVDNNVNVKFV